MNTSISADKPVSTEDEDKFQRYNFSKRIAKTILNRDYEDCIVIGIYGAWGEGKTSVLNFIQQELRKNNDAIIVKFNPWRYKDEDSLLIHFFEEVAKAFDKELKTSKQKAGEFLRKYSQYLKFSIAGINIGSTAESAGEALAKIDVEDLKASLNEIIKESRQKVVIFIDDIDRLDKNEIHAIFKLVKLTADFENTTYILSFDDAMVAAAIADRYGEGNIRAGQQFLAKIIQVPLRIPYAQPFDLQNLCIGAINKILEINKIELSEEEAIRFRRHFTGCILLQLKNPRLAVRYSNALFFSIPLLAGEANIVDLMLIEAVKIFFPDIYEFIRVNPECFVGSYRNITLRKLDDEKLNTAKEFLDDIDKSFSKKQSKGLRNLLEAIFPKILEVYQSAGSENTSPSIDSLNKNSKIGAPHYFDRYFSYTVLKGQISDIEFNDFIFSIPNLNEAQVLHGIKEIISKSDVDKFIQKVNNIADDLPWNIIGKLARSLSLCHEVFPKVNESIPGMLMFPFSSLTQLIFGFFEFTNITKDALLLASEIIAIAAHFEFAFELNNCFQQDGLQPAPIWEKEDYDFLALKLLERALKDAISEPLLYKYPNQAAYLYEIWAKNDKSALDKQINRILDYDCSKATDLIELFARKAWNTSKHNYLYTGNFSKEQYDIFIKIIDKEAIRICIEKTYQPHELTGENINWEEKNGPYQTKSNLTSQFMFWYQGKARPTS